MRFAGHFIARLVLAVLFSVSVRAAAPSISGNPYLAVAVRNIFALVPIPTNNPADSLPPPEPPPKITPNGIMKIFGNVQVLFKVATKPPPGQPQKDDSYVMSEGERQDEIEVVKIDGKADVVTFNNHGIVQELPLVAGTAKGGPAVSPATGARLVFPALRSNPTAGGTTVLGSIGNRSAQQPAANRSAGADNGFPSMGMKANAPEEALTPEAQVIMMEAQRADWIQKGNPAAAIIPPTSITHLVTGENGGGAPQPPMP